ncbi:MAG TPA: hypothetical protein VIX81_00315 [Gammaproteobacteria bacterium]
MKLLKLVLALLLIMVAVNYEGMGGGFLEQLLASFGSLKEVVTAGLIVWLLQPWFSDAL